MTAAAASPKLSPKQRHYEQIVEMNKDCKFAYAEYIEAKEEAKELKSKSDRLSAHLHEYISRGPELQQILELLFEDSPTAIADTPVADTAAGDADCATPATASDEGPPPSPICLPADHWRMRPIKELGLTEGLNEALATAGIRTLGGLTDYWGAKRYLFEVKGIGLAHYESVSDAFKKYLDRHAEISGGVQPSLFGNGSEGTTGGTTNGCVDATAAEDGSSSPAAGEATSATPEAEVGASDVASANTAGAAATDAPRKRGAAASETVAGDADRWQAREIAVLQLPPSTYMLLRNIEIHSLGDLNHYWAASKSLKSAKGFDVDEAKIVAAAWNKYVKAHPEVDSGS